MKAICIALICCATAIACAWMLTTAKKPIENNTRWLRDVPRAPEETYEIHTEGGRIFVFNRQTGEAWRYFVNRDDKGGAQSEGFAQMAYLPLPGARTSPTAAPWADFTPAK